MHKISYTKRKSAHWIFDNPTFCFQSEIPLWEYLPVSCIKVSQISLQHVNHASNRKSHSEIRRIGRRIHTFPINLPQ